MKQHLEARERLIEAAREAFAKDGFEGASVRDITTRARANLGAITYHFGSKEALYHAVIERFAEPLADRLAAISREGGAPLERLALAVRAFMEHMWSHPEMPCLIVQELASNRPLPPPVAKVIRRNVESFTRMITEGQADGSIRPGEPHLFAMSIAGQPMFLALAGRAIREALGVDPGDPTMRHLITEHVIATLKAAFASPAAAAASAHPNPSQDRTP
ncbi:MAG TPA: TetR/AcrR family transcriptional regulator [Gemmatimonadales bacterium]|nr:TetR/AcrR family transcriptional regulator [Gemmatimonadales bacterium]